MGEHYYKRAMAFSIVVAGIMTIVNVINYRFLIPWERSQTTDIPGWVIGVNIIAVAWTSFWPLLLPALFIFAVLYFHIRSLRNRCRDQSSTKC